MASKKTSGTPWTPEDYEAAGWVRRTLRLRTAVSEALGAYQARHGGLTLNDALAKLLRVRPGGQAKSGRKRERASENRLGEG